METADLIRSLAVTATPVRRLRPPLVRALSWLSFAALMMAVMVVSHGVHPHFGQLMQDSVGMTSMVASLVTGILATIATFFVSLPDRSRVWLLLPLPALVVWLSTIGYQCFAGWVPMPSGGASVETASDCFATLVVTSLPLSLTLLGMLRHAAPLRPTAVLLMGSLAISAITASALSMFHPLDATAMILGWNFGAAVLFLAAAAMVDRVTSSRRRVRRD